MKCLIFNPLWRRKPAATVHLNRELLSFSIHIGQAPEIVARYRTKARHEKVPAVASAAFTAYVAIVGIWLPFAALLLSSGGSPEASLRVMFGRYSRPDAFSSVDRIAGLSCILHTLLCALAVIAVSRRRFDVVTVLCIGPSLALLVYVIADGISDPAWYTFLALCSIGETVSIVVALGYWATKPSVRRSQAFRTDGPVGTDSDAN
jgi:hypothetical protein